MSSWILLRRVSKERLIWIKEICRCKEINKKIKFFIQLNKKREDNIFMKNIMKNLVNLIIFILEELIGVENKKLLNYKVIL